MNMEKFQNSPWRKTAQWLPALLLAAALSGCGGGAEGTSPAEAATARGEEGLQVAGCSPLCNGACAQVQLGDVYGLDQPILAFGEHVYFSGAITYEASYSFFGRVPQEGGASSLFAQNLDRPARYVSSGDSAYAILRYPRGSAFSHVNKIGSDGSLTPVPGIDGTSVHLGTVDVDGTSLYAMDGNDNLVWSAPLTGGPWTQATLRIANGLGRSIRVDGSSVYLVTDNVNTNQSTVWKAPKGTRQTARKLVTLPGSLVSLTFDETHLYFTNRTGGLFRISKNGGSATPLASTAAGLSVALDAERYYWFNGTALTATCKNGGGSQVLATVSSSPTSTPNVLSVDNEAIYWRDSSRIWKVVK